MTSDERHRRKRARGDPSSSSSSSNPAPPDNDISEPPFTFEFIRSVANTMERFGPPNHLLPTNCCPVCGTFNHSYLGHFSPSSNGASAPSSTGPDTSAALFTPDFIQSVANSLDEFDPSFLRPDGDINFERDFGQWFNHPDDVGGH
ncbi:hypothetical protein EDD18DRAFT_748078 [Armillaria luteobubalina]|uniref:Uncharacterized protein n=1 Tax=Armillaria luteobubalina TaxID=153913 RepID=A0AA39QF37_9AGAR|nr:hypothetical protein EDD18DRAFT_748078 [Armillaria luteobubalina]